MEAATIHNIHQQSFAKTLQKMMESIENPISFCEMTPSKFGGGWCLQNMKLKHFGQWCIHQIHSHKEYTSTLPKHWHGPQMIAVIH